MCHTHVGIDRKTTCNIGTGQLEDNAAIVVFTKTEIQSSYALKVSVLKGYDKETQSSSEGLSKVRNIVDKRVEGVELRASTNPRSDSRLEKGYLDGSEANIC